MGVLLAIMSSAMWGTADFLGGTLTRRLPAAAVVLGSQALALPVTLVLAVWTGAWRSPTGYLPWAIAAAVVGLAALGLFYAALAQGTMGIVSPIAALGVLVPLGVGLLRGEVPSPVQYLGIVVALVGLILACGPELSGAAKARPVLLALAAAFGFGVCLLFIAQGSASSAVMTMTTMRVVSTAIALVAILLARGTGGVGRGDLPMLALVGMFDVLANLSFGVATRLALLPVVAVLGSLYPVATVLLARWVHHERLAPVQYAGVAVALAGVVAITAAGPA